jgi:SOS-response transcriptional repressor LexA
MSKRALQIYETLQCWLASRPYPPTFRELADICGLCSSSTAYLYLCRLREAGLVTWLPERARTLEVCS